MFVRNVRDVKVDGGERGGLFGPATMILDEVSWYASRGQHANAAVP
jgi:hypothetical protein